MSAEPREISFAEVNDDVVRSLVVTGRGYYVTLATSVAVMFACFLFPWSFQLYYGLGASGINHPGVPLF